MALDSPEIKRIRHSDGCTSHGLCATITIRDKEVHATLLGYCLGYFLLSDLPAQVISQPAKITELHCEFCWKILNENRHKWQIWNVEPLYTGYVHTKPDKFKTVFSLDWP